MASSGAGRSNGAPRIAPRKPSFSLVSAIIERGAGTPPGGNSAHGSSADAVAERGRHQILPSTRRSSCADVKVAVALLMRTTSEIAGVATATAASTIDDSKASTQTV